jgi:hypothetical protein
MYKLIFDGLYSLLEDASPSFPQEMRAAPEVPVMLVTTHHQSKEVQSAHSYLKVQVE